jgi:hypothetical protein
MAVYKLSAANLKTAAPELGTPDFTEIRMIPSPFPKESERACYKFLLTKMQATPDQRPGTRAEFEKTCRRRFRVTVASFEICWREAIKVTGARWNQPGRRRI